MHELHLPHAEKPADPGFVGIDTFFGQAQPGPRGSDLHPVLAQFEVQAHSCELDPYRAIEAITGESIKFVHVRGIPGALWELGRAPSGSKSKLDGSRLVPDVPGLFVVSVTLPGNYRREILIAAFTLDALDAVGFLPAQQLERRLRLRKIIQDPNATRASLEAGLESGPADLATVAGYVGKKRNGFRLESYGSGVSR
jgi:hypothetical protein